MSESFWRDRRPNHVGFTADMFLIRDDRFLVLTRTGQVGGGTEYLPGGVVEPGEDAEDAAIRETLEETGLTVRDVSLLRAWSYPTPEGWETVHATFVGYSDVGEVEITAEHSAHRWVTPDEHVARWCPAEFDDAYPQWAGWFRQVRRNCELIVPHLKAATP